MRACALLHACMHAWWRSSSIRSVAPEEGTRACMVLLMHACMIEISSSLPRSSSTYGTCVCVCACSARSSKCKARIAYYATTWVLPFHPAMLALRSKIKRTIHLFVLRNSKAGDHVDGATRRVMMHVSRLRIYFAVTTHTALYCVCCNPALCVSINISMFWPDDQLIIDRSKNHHARAQIILDTRSIDLSFILYIYLASSTYGSRWIWIDLSTSFLQYILQ